MHNHTLQRHKRFIIVILLILLNISNFVKSWGSSNNNKENNNKEKTKTRKRKSLKLLGLNPEHEEYFSTAKSAGKFTCLDNSLTISWSSVNDDYCDCKDGSDEPGTSACSNSIFFCTNKNGNKLLQQKFPSSFVNDGFCDCCDGSDESKKVIKKKCPKNKCKHLVRNEKKLKKYLIKKHEKGFKTRRKRGSLKELKEKFKVFKESTFSEMEKHKQVQTKELQRIHAYFQKAQAAKQPPDPRAYQALAQTQHSLKGMEFHKAMLEKLGEKHLGYRMEFFPLLNEKCIRSPYINEKRFKGGTPNVIPQIYQIELCPFRTVTIMEINHTEWDKKETFVKQGGNLQRYYAEEQDKIEMEINEMGNAIGADGKPTQPIVRNEVGDEESGKTLLGVWDDWALPETISNNVKKLSSAERKRMRYSMMRYSNGEKCADGIGVKGIHRHVDIEVVCGLTTQIVDGYEDVCHYNLKLETPAACTLKESRRIKDEMDEW